MDRNERLANESYLKMRRHWLNLHLKTIYITSFVYFCVEVIMFFVRKSQQLLIVPSSTYILTYIIIPSLICLILSLIGRYIVMSQKIEFKKKQYIISFLALMISFMITILYNRYVSVFIVLALPIIFTIFYEDKKLLYSLSCSGILLQIISALYIGDNTLNIIYIMNVCVIVFITCFIILICVAMMYFLEIRKSYVITNVKERFDLQTRIKLDGLTKVGNKQSLLDSLRKIIEEKSLCYLVMMDIDKFKYINDHYGHIQGDETLKRIGRVLKECSPQNSVFRYGGDEFCILLEGSKKDVYKVVFNIQEILKNQGRNVDEAIMMSVGIAFNEAYASVDEWVCKADEAMYESKKLGGDTIQFYKKRS